MLFKNNVHFHHTYTYCIFFMYTSTPDNKNADQNWHCFQLNCVHNFYLYLSFLHVKTTFAKYKLKTCEKFIFWILIWWELCYLFKDNIAFGEDHWKNPFDMVGECCVFILLALSFAMSKTKIPSKILVISPMHSRKKL